MLLDTNRYNMEEKNINHLLEMCDEYFIQGHHCNNYIRHCKNTWQRGILSYMNDRGVDIYSPEIGEDYLTSDEGAGLVEKYPLVMRRGIHMLNDLVTTGVIRKRFYSRIEYPLDGEIGLMAKVFISSLKEKRRCEHTLSNYRRFLSQFIQFLYGNGVLSISEMKEEQLFAYMDALQLQKRETCVAIKAFVRYLKKNKIVGMQFDYFLDSFKVRKKERIPSFYSEAEVLKFESSVNRNTPMGKRNYAIVLLASRLGLRAADIGALEFSEINWAKSLIRITTKKTGKEVELPLLAEVGNALIEYLQHGRPKSSSKKIFLLSKAPYGEINSTIVSNVIRSVMRKSGVDTSQRKKGPHSLRHTLATTLLGKNTGMTVISEILGHQSTDTTNVYLKIDIASLLKCVLSVPLVPKAFYSQIEKGGLL